MKSASLFSVLAAVLLSPSLTAQTPGFSTVVEFTGTTGLRLGGACTTALMEHSDGNLYGTTSRGGTANFGTIFRLTKTGTFSTVKSLTGTGVGAGGFYPSSSLTQHTDGVLYGVNEGNGDGLTAGGFGNTYKITTTGVYTPIHVFGGTGTLARGRTPISGLTAAGVDFYGTTDAGGTSTNHGTLFKYTPATNITIYLLDFTYNGASNRGSQPWGKLLNGGDGFLYGTTYGGGGPGFGTIFKVNISSGQLTTLVEFTGSSSPYPGKYPADRLLRASDGNLYGTTINGGVLNAGVVFRINPVTGAYAAIVEFTNNSGGAQGAGPYSGLVEGPDGFLYGTTEYLGPGATGNGTIYRVSLSGQITHRLVDFSGTTTPHKGSHPWGGLMKTTEGIIYGTTLDGGEGNFGTIWKLDTALLPKPPVVTTGSATAITSTGATLNASVNPNSLATAWQFEYGTTTAYGTSAPVPPNNLTAGTTAQAVSHTLSGLTPNTLYHFRIKAQSTAGLTTGLDGTFTTTSGTSQAPVVVTNAASGVTGSTATLNGTVNPQGNATTWQFEYGTTTSYGNVMPAVADTAGNGTSAVPVTSNLTGLPGGTTFHYRLKATNSAGTSFGADQTFSTTGSPPTPVVVTGAATEIAGTTAVLNGTVNPRGSLTTWQFRYGLTVTANDNTAPVTPASIGDSINPEIVNVSIVGLSPGVTYYYKLTATNSAGPVTGTTGSFTAAVAPTATTQAALDITTTGASVVGTVNPRGNASTWQFEYGSDTSYGQLAPVPAGTTGTGTSPEFVTHTFTGLAPGTTIHYRLKATNGAGTSYGSDFTFTTLQAPTVTAAAQNVTATSVSLTGTVNPHGYATTWQFDYGTSDAYGTSVPASPGNAGSGTTAGAVSVPLTALLPNTTYHFRLRATSANGTSTTPNATFTTNNNVNGWRQIHFGTMNNTGNAADNADPDGDGVFNLAEYGFGMNPKVPDRQLLPQPSYNGSTLLASFTGPPGIFDLIYSAEVSTNLTNWSPIADGGAGLVHSFVSPITPGGRNWMRLRVTLIP